MASDKPLIAIIGAGMGGLTAAAVLRRMGCEVRVFEQAAKFARVGAGIQMSPNAMCVLRGLGLEEPLRRIGFQPPSWMNKTWDSGEMQFEFPLGAPVEARYGLPYLMLHRGDLHQALLSLVPPEWIELNRQLVGVAQHSCGMELRFSDGPPARADIVIAADGVHSRVREILLGPEEPRFTGRAAYRAVFPASLLGAGTVGHYTKWWGPDRHIVIYFVGPRKEEIYFVTSVPEPEYRRESWSARGDLGGLRKAFEGFHEEVQRVLAACPEVHKWAILERDPLPRWSDGRIALLGDACHPMTPYMAQGAATALEDAVVLSRCIEEIGLGEMETAFTCYEATRKERTSLIQLNSHLNRFMSGPTDPDWVYRYDAWREPLRAPARP